MRNSIVRIAVFCVAVVGAAAALWVVPSYAQRTQGTLGQPGMTEARVWVNNRTRDEAIPVTWVGGDARTPVPVAVQGVATVSVNGLVEARATATKQPWEYRSVSVGADQDLAPALNGLGSEGWEAVGVTSQPGAKVTVLLKRPK